LPGRQNIVITRNPEFEAVGADVCTSLSAAVDVSSSGEIMVIGGGQLYALALPLAQRMVLTMIDIQPDADTWFPEWQKRDWQLRDERYFQADEKNGLAYRILELHRTC
jgi:dihydrofolate reductase